MANTLDVKESFIELRAKGLSFDKIASKISVSKPTLIRWGKELNYEIKNRRAIEDEALIEKYIVSKKHQVELLDQQLKAVRKELDKRDYSDYSTKELLDLATTLQDRLVHLTRGISFSEQGNGIVPISTTENWVA